MNIELMIQMFPFLQGSACSAIMAPHGKDVTGSGQTVKCSRGKEQVPSMEGGRGGGGYQQGGGYPSYGQPGG